MESSFTQFRHYGASAGRLLHNAGHFLNTLPILVWNIKADGYRVPTKAHLELRGTTPGDRIVSTIADPLDVIWMNCRRPAAFPKLFDVNASALAVGDSRKSLRHLALLLRLTQAGCRKVSRGLLPYLTFPQSRRGHFLSTRSNLVIRDVVPS